MSNREFEYLNELYLKTLRELEETQNNIMQANIVSVVAIVLSLLAIFIRIFGVL